MGKKITKVIAIILAVIVLIIAALLGVSMGVHRSKLAKEEAFLAEKGYFNLVEARDCSLNVCTFGSDKPQHTVVGISGHADGRFAFDMRNTIAPLTADNRFVFIDRAGYGMSEDSSVSQSAECIVENYRAALKNAGIDAPYVLMPHSLGGIYATYWETKYPDEIEGVVFIDSVTTYENIVGIEEESDVNVFIFRNSGLQRLLAPYENFTVGFTDEEIAIDEALNWKNFASNAKNSELQYYKANMGIVHNMIKANDVPKVYIAAKSAVQNEKDLQEHTDWLGEYYGYNSKMPEDVDEYLAANKAQFEDEVKPFAESVGNCEIVQLPGEHFIYLQKPGELAEMIGDFLKKLK